MKKSSIVALAIATAASAFAFVNVVLATGYTTHEAVPGQSTTNSFTELLAQIYNFSIGSAAILAMIMIGVGAFTYIVTSAGNASKVANAKDMIFSAIFGLVIAMVAWITLFLINPDLVRGDLSNMSSTHEYITGGGF